VIVFGAAVTDPEKYRRWAGAGIDRIREPDSAVYPNIGSETLFRNYNLLLDMAAKHDDLEALVLVHQDTEIVDPGFCAKLRAALSEPDVAIAGCVGALGVRSIAWWQGSVTWGSFIHRYYEYGGGDLPAMTWDSSDPGPVTRLGEVDTLDGFLLVMSPWAVRNLRFDESLGQLHGYDFDICLQAREQGRKVVTADFKAIHHHSLDLVGDPDGWVQAHIRVAEKWDGRMPGVGVAGGDWRHRARRAEAEAAVSQVVAHAHGLKAIAQVQEMRRELDEMKGSLGWRITEPLRRANQLRKRLRVRRNGAEQRS
jgi:hypothetical protein